MWRCAAMVLLPFVAAETSSPAPNSLNETASRRGAVAFPTVALQDTGYVFAGFGNATEAREACRSHGGLPMPKSVGEQRDLQRAMDVALASGRLSPRWPQNTVWLGGRWSTAAGGWQWDDGSVLAGGAAAPRQMLSIGASSAQHAEPWLCMVASGMWQDSLPSFEFGILCRPDGQFNCDEGHDSWEKSWSADKKAVCCKHGNRRCTPPLESTSNSTSKADTSTATTATTTVPEQDLVVTLPDGSTATTTPGMPSANTSTRGMVPQQNATAGDGGTQKDGCYEDSIAWEPLSMPTVAQPIMEVDAAACQRRCESTPGCAHFSFWALGRHCYLQDAFAIRQPGRAGFVSGPFKCWDQVNHSSFAKVGEKTYLHEALRCVELGAVYTPAMAVPTYLARELSAEEAARACKRHCASVKGCAHWTLELALRVCTLAGLGADRSSQVISSVSGPPSCQEPAAAPAFADDSLGSELIVAAAMSEGDKRPWNHKGPWFRLGAALALLAGGAACAASSAAVAIVRVSRIRSRYHALSTPPAGDIEAAIPSDTPLRYSGVPQLSS